MDANRISITPTVARQTPKQDFGQVLQNSVNGVLNAGNLVGSMTGMPIVSSAVSAVTSLVNARTSAGSAATGVVNIGTGAGSTSLAGGNTGIPGSSVSGVTSTVANGAPSGMGDMLKEMQLEAHRSIATQIAMQNESREYNTLTNILKLRHDSAKAAINNIR